jgi:signal peptidase II
VKRWIKLLIFAIVLLLIDIALKFYVSHYVEKMSWMHPFYPYGGIGVFRNFFGISFSINFVENTGAAWGMFSKYPLVLFYIRVLIVIGLIIYLLTSNKDRKKEMPLILIITGATGNILDYIFYRKVIDMFLFKFWGYSYPIFNFADFLITIGVIWLFIIFFIQKIKRKKINED